MRVKLYNTASGPRYAGLAGATIDVSEEDAMALVESGGAVYDEPEPEELQEDTVAEGADDGADQDTPETATDGPQEKAVQPKARVGSRKPRGRKGK